MLVTDNGPSFASSEFTDFVKANGIEHVKTVPYHPASNGLAKRAVHTFKTCMKKLSNGSLRDRVNSFLFKYCTTPQTTTGVCPAELLMGCKLWTHLDLLVPDIGERVRKRQNLQKYSREFQENEAVLAKNFSQGPPWITGKILKKSGATTFLVEIPNGQVIGCHADQLKHNSFDPQIPLQQDADEQRLPSDTDLNKPHQEMTEHRHSTRIRHPPVRFSPDNYWLLFLY